MKLEIIHRKVASFWSGAAICGQSGNPTVYWGDNPHRVTCRKCRRILRLISK